MIRALSRGLAIAALVMFQGEARAQADLDTQPALGAAQSWLALLDAGSYGAGWDAAAPALRESMTRTQWELGLERNRGPLGVAVVRKLRQATCLRDGDPPVETCTILYDARFENRPLTIEALIALRGADGAWRVSAYSLR